MKNFFRKVAFGIGANEKVPNDPLTLSLNQINQIPELSWKGKIYTEKELRKYYREWVYGDRKGLRKKDKENKVVEGNPDKIKTVTDYWKFSKNIFSKNPNWYLCEIVNK